MEVKNPGLRNTILGFRTAPSCFHFSSFLKLPFFRLKIIRKKVNVTHIQLYIGFYLSVFCFMSIFGLRN